MRLGDYADGAWMFVATCGTWVVRHAWTPPKC